MSEKKLEIKLEIKTTEKVLDEAYKKLAKLLGKENLESIEESEVAKVAKEILACVKNTKWVSAESLKQVLAKIRKSLWDITCILGPPPNPEKYVTIEKPSENLALADKELTELMKEIKELEDLLE